MTDAAGSFDQGVSLQSDAKFEEAIEAFDKAIEEDAKNGKAWYHKAVCLMELERYNEAMECVGTAIQIDPRDLDALKLKFGLAGKVS
ncbi:MAG TPA: tetratricopeptide repeat protein [Candidatus Anoxymicrobiaceae bacterium]